MVGTGTCPGAHYRVNHDWPPANSIIEYAMITEAFWVYNGIYTEYINGIMCIYGVYC